MKKKYTTIIHVIDIAKIIKDITKSIKGFSGSIFLRKILLVLMLDVNEKNIIAVTGTQNDKVIFSLFALGFRRSVLSPTKKNEKIKYRE